ncbi:MAG: MFS transporter [Labilithrix sp.]|nr:MFS transporter [Labilithrix sp.]MCW5813961.1 MFS transporter [Labilithrix sp.]
MIQRPSAILALLTGLNLLNYLDRLVLSAVLPKLIEELGLSQLQGGLLATVFMVGYLATSPIFGMLGDRLPRKGLIAIGVLVWSAATVASGLAGGLMALLAARALVGIGEASYATLAPTIIDDITPAERKGRALATFYLATPVGGALGYIIGGQVAHHFGWRAAFWVAGGPGVLLAIVCLFILEPARKPREDKPNVARDFVTLAKTKLYRQCVLGYCAYTAAIGAFSHWAPHFLVRRYGLGLDTASTVFGALIVVCGGGSTIVGGRWADRVAKGIADRLAHDTKDPEKLYREQGYRDATPEEIAERVDLARRERVRGLLKICGVGSLVGAPLAAGAFLSPAPAVFFAVVAVAVMFLFLCTSPVNAVILQAVPSHLRASAMALSILSIHVLGDLWSPPLVGLLADNMPIQLAMMTLPLAIAASAAVWWPKRDAAPAHKS